MRTAALAILAVIALPCAASASPELVVDLGTGRVLHAREAQAPWHPASLTKLMTTYVALRAVAAGELQWDSTVTLSSASQRVQPSRSGLRTGARLTLADALRVLMVKSANDVAIAVAEAVGGDVPRFVARMNSESARLGMVASHWVNPHGLDAMEQLTTARDLAVLAAAIRRDFPAADPLFSIRAVALDGVVMGNHNKAVGRMPEIDGMKTGYICASGFNVVTTATRGGRRVAVVLLGRDGAMERDARASLLATAALGTQSTGIGGLDDFKGASAARPVRRSCGKRGSPEGEDALVAPAAMAQWVRDFASRRIEVGEPVAIASLPPASQVPAPSIGSGTDPFGAARPAMARAIASVPAPAAAETSAPPLAYVGPAAAALGPTRAPRRF